MENFWQKLPRPFTVLAPMDGVTDAVFRQIICELGRPDVFFTEFTSCDAIMSKGKERALQNLMFGKKQKPIVAQIWGANPENFYNAVKIAGKLEFSGIDINMGCPDRTVSKDGACSGLIKNPALAAEIIKATKKGAGNLPISIKTRIGIDKPDINYWIVFLLEQNLDAISIHLRTVKELSKVPAHWELMPEIIEARNKISPKTLIIGNGDIRSLDEVQNKYNQFGCEGFMIGTGIFANPWVFNKSVKSENIKPSDRLQIYLKHIDLFSKTWGKDRNFENLKKFCKMYVNNFDNAALLREKIMQTKNLNELKNVVNTVLE